MVGAWQATAPRIQVASTVGAGDSSLAGYLLADVDGRIAAEDRLRRAVRYGAAAASLPGTQAPTPDDLPAGDRRPVLPSRLIHPRNRTTDHWRSSCPRPSRQSSSVSTLGLGADKAAVIRALAARVVAQGRATDAEALFADAWAREQKDETGLPGGIAIPHAKSAAVTDAVARVRPARRRASTSARPTVPPTSSSSSPRPRALPRRTSRCSPSSPAASCRTTSPAACAPPRRTTRSSRSCATRSARAMPAPAAAPAAAAAAPATAAVAAGPHASTAAPPASSRSPRVRPASPTPSWPPTRSPPQGKKAGIDLIVEPQGSSGYKALPAERDRRRRRRDLRDRRRRARAAAVRRQARDPLGRQARHRAAGRR